MLHAGFGCQHPRILESATLRRVDNHLARHRRVSSQARIPHVRILAGDHEGTQIALARRHLAGLRVHHIDITELNHLLGNESTRLLLDPVGELLTCGGIQRRTKHHAVTAGFGHILDDQLAHPIQDFLAVGLEHRHVRGRVVENRFLAEIVLDHLRHEVVDGLVIGRAVAQRVDDGHVARAVGGQDTGHTDHRIRIEGERVEEFVGQAAVDHAHTVAFAGVVEEVDLVVHHFEVFGEGQRRTGFLRQIGVLEERGIVAAGSQYHGDALGGDKVHGFAQQARVFAIIANTNVAEQARGDAALDVAHEQRVAGTRGNTQVVFQHPPSSVLALDQVLAGDVSKNAAGRGHAVDLREVAGRGVYVFLRHHAVMDDGLVGVDVLQIGVQGVDALLQALLQFVVFVGFDNARHRVVREQPVMVFAVLVDAETHTVAGQLSIDRFAAVYQFMGQSACCGFDHRACSLLWRLLWLQAVRRVERTLKP